MGWASGQDSSGRMIGYAHEATCEHPGCTKKIHRGLAYACGGQHGVGVGFCDGYFCYAHLLHDNGSGEFVCESCAAPDDESDGAP